MHVFDALTTLQLLILNIYARVIPDNTALIILAKFCFAKDDFAANLSNFASI